MDFANLQNKTNSRTVTHVWQVFSVKSRHLKQLQKIVHDLRTSTNRRGYEEILSQSCNSIYSSAIILLNNTYHVKTIFEQTIWITATKCPSNSVVDTFDFIACNW